MVTKFPFDTHATSTAARGPYPLWRWGPWHFDRMTRRAGLAVAKANGKVSGRRRKLAPADIVNAKTLLADGKQLKVRDAAAVLESANAPCSVSHRLLRALPSAAN